MLATLAAWAYFAVINPTVGGAVVAGVFSVVNTLILLRHERHIDDRFDERRNVITKIGEEGEDTVVVVTTEDRREGPERRVERKSRKLRDRRRRERRNDGL